MRRSALIVTGVAVPVAVAVAVGLFALASVPPSPPAGAIASTPSRGQVSPSVAPADGEAAVAQPSACPLTDALPPGDSATAPVDLDWLTVDGAAWPTSSTVGPTGERDDLPACFERSDRGAALAAATILFAQVDRSPLQTWATYAAPTSGRAKLLETLNGHSVSDVYDAVTTPGAEAVGYRIDESAPDRVDLTLALRIPGDDGLRGWRLALVWNESDAVGGDWLLRVREDGSVGDAVAIEETKLIVWPR